MNNSEIIKKHNENVMGTYGRYSVVITGGNGSILTDADGKEYIDFTSGIGVNSLGAANNGWIDAVTEQLKKIQHVSNYYYNDTSAALAELLIKRSGMNKVFFSNSGAEANEGAIKLVRKYSFDKYGAEKKRYKIITLKDSFHGRTMATLSATGQPVFHNFFFPFVDGFSFIEPNNIDELKKTSEDETVCAFMLEPIQGESGVNLIDAEYVKAAAKICGEKDILLIFDEVQTGIGRTGKFFAHEYFAEKPDVVTIAKGLGGGLPIGAFMCNEKLQSVLTVGTHGSTFGGNPVSAAGAIEVLNTIDNKFLDEVCEKGDYITQKISEFGNKNIIKQIRHKGLMIGVQIDGNPKEYAKKCMENGLLILTAGTDVLRFLPPLNITYGEIDRGLAILKALL